MVGANAVSGPWSVIEFLYSYHEEVINYGNKGISAVSINF